MSNCSLARNLEDFAETFFELENKSTQWKIKETSFTDVILAAFSMYGHASAHVDASKEAVTGADMEILLRGHPYGPVVFLVQAKRSSWSSSKKKGWSYKELFHKPAMSSKTQVQQLVDYCAGASYPVPHVPVYAFFHGKSAAAKIGSRGISVIPAQVVLKGSTETGNKKLACHHYKQKTKHFSSLFCQNSYELVQKWKIDFLSTVSEAVIESELESSRIDEKLVSDWLEFRRDFGDGRATHRRLVVRHPYD